MMAARGAAKVRIASFAPLVGRDGEMQRLQRLLQAASSGRSQLAVLHGEAGIGKTRLLRELVERNAGSAAARIAHCVSHLGAPYAPLVMLLSGAIADGLIKGESEGKVRSLVQRLTSAEDASLREETPEWEQTTARVRLFLELREAIVTLVGGRPTVLVIEDTHWVDRNTANFLEFFGLELLERTLSLPLLLVLTRRDLEGQDPRLGKLEQVPPCATIHLVPFSELEVDELIRGYGITRPSRELVSRLHEASRGNPLYIQEVLRRLEELEAFSERRGLIEAYVSGHELSPPSGLAELVHRRLEGVSIEALDLLRLASIIGEEFEPEFLAALHPGGIEPLVDQAIVAGLLIAKVGSLAFAHPIIRQVVYDQLPPEERRRIHRRIAERLRAEDRETHDRAREIAHHLLESGDEGDEQALEYFWRAGLQAHRIAAWRSAIRYFEEAIALGERLAIPETKLGWLKYWAGRSHWDDYDAPIASDLLHEASEIGKRSGDVELWCRAALDDVHRRMTSSPDLMRGTVDTSGIDEILSEIGEDRPDLRGPLLTAYCSIRMAAFDFKAGIAMGQEAVRLARLTNDDAQIARAESTLGMALLGVGDATGACNHLGPAAAGAAESGDVETEAYSCARNALALWMLGRIDEAEQATEQASKRFDSTRHRSGQCLVAAIRAALSVVRGDFQAAERHGQLCERLYAQSEYYFAPLVLYPALIEARSSQGDHEASIAALNAWKATGQGGRYLSRIVALLRGGRLEEARERFRGDPRLIAMARIPSMVSVGSIGALAEAASAFQDLDLAATLESAIEKLPDDRVIFSPGSGHMLPWTRGVLARQLGRASEAEQWLTQAVAVAEAVNAPPELARARLELGRVLAEDRSRKEKAAENFRLAVELFESLGMFVHLGEGRACLELLQAEPPVSRSPKFILMSDIARSTEVSVEEGDEAYLRLVDAHHAVLRRCLREFGGTEVDVAGDGMLAWLPSGRQAVGCALAVQAEFARHGPGSGTQGPSVRIGLTSGNPIERAGRLYGAAVNLCERLSKVAEPGQIVMSGGAFDELPEGTVTRRLGELRLKGFSQPIEACVVTTG